MSGDEFFFSGRILQIHIVYATDVHPPPPSAPADIAAFLAEIARQLMCGRAIPRVSACNGARAIVLRRDCPFIQENQFAHD